MPVTEFKLSIKLPVHQWHLWPITSEQGTCQLNAFQDISTFVWEKNKKNKKKLRPIFDHKIAMPDPIYTREVSPLSWQNVLSDERNITIFLVSDKCLVLLWWSHLEFTPRCKFFCKCNCSARSLIDSLYCVSWEIQGRCETLLWITKVCRINYWQICYLMSQIATYFN